MYLSKLLGPVKKPIFEILYRSSLRAGIQLEQSGLELTSFLARFLQLARESNLKIELLDKSSHLYLVEKMAWLIVIADARELHNVRAEFLQRLVHVDNIIGTFVLVCSFPPRWGWAQVSEGKRINARASKAEAQMEHERLEAAK